MNCDLEAIRDFCFLCWVLVTACRILSCGIRDLVPWPGIKCYILFWQQSYWAITHPLKVYDSRNSLAVQWLGLSTFTAERCVRVCVSVSVCVCVCVSVCVQWCLTLMSWTVAHQAPLSTEHSRQEYWSGFPFPPSVFLPDPGMETESLVSPMLAGGFFTLRKPYIYIIQWLLVCSGLCNHHHI